MPESVRDRCTKAHEYIFLLTKSAKYYFDHEAMLDPPCMMVAAKKPTMARPNTSMPQAYLTKRYISAVSVIPTKYGRSAVKTKQEQTETTSVRYGKNNLPATNAVCGQSRQEDLRGHTLRLFRLP
jgi:hypothetical protein